MKKQRSEHGIPQAGVSGAPLSLSQKRPYLLPVAWMQRIAHYASEKQSGTDNSASGSIKLGKERIELMKRYGIMD